MAEKIKKNLLQVKRHWQLFIFMIPAVLYFIIFRYVPMVGVQIAFRDYNPLLGFFDSNWAGLKHFIRFFNTTDCWMVIGNTLKISFLNLILGFPIPIILALLINQTKNLRYKKLVQTVIYAPHFISAVIIAGMLRLFLSPTSGIINTIIVALGGEAQMFMGSASAFPWIYVLSEIWQGMGYSSIVYVAALSSVSPELHESAIVDGATMMQRIKYIDFPSIIPTIIIILIMNAGTMDEYYAALEAFKTQDPNGNGIADEIPYTFVAFHHINGYSNFFGAYGQAETFNGKSGNPFNHFNVVDGKVQFNAISEEYKEAINNLKPYIDAGLFDQEGFVQDNSQYNAKVTAATPIVGSMNIWDLTSLPEDVKQQYVAIEPLKASETSDSSYVRKRQNHISIQPTGLAITLNCKNADILAQWIDLFYSDDMSILTYAGLNCERSVDGVFTYDETLSESGENLMTVAGRENPFDGSPKYLTQDMRDNLFPLKSGQNDKADVIAKFYSSAKNITYSLPSMNLTNEENDFVNSYGIDVQNFVDTNHCNWLLGTSDIDADWDTYLAQLEKLQLEKYISIMQGAYDRTVAK